MIDLTINEEQLERTAKLCREKNIIIPTFEEQKHPEKIPEKIKEELKDIELWEVHPRNLFRITWKNEPVKKGGGFDGVNYFVIPPELSGVDARIVMLVGKWFPTGAHKVGATFGVLVPKLVTGQFDPEHEKAVWPSTGNYCRGGAYDAALLGCESIAILPEEMSKERVEWLKSVAGEIILTPGCESNVKEIYDKCHELEKTRENIHIFNQFSEFGNYLWHYEVTGNAMVEVLNEVMGKDDEIRGVTLTTGSAGTIASGDFLKEVYPHIKIAAGEALQCPTLLRNGYGGHRIEGIGDKHVPWIHNVKNTDMVIAIDDNDTINIMRLFNEPEGKKFLIKQGVPESVANKLNEIGISGIANLLMAIKFAKYYELGKNDVVITLGTDSMELYQSRLQETRELYGEYTEKTAIKDFYGHLRAQKIDNMLELDYYSRRRIHNLKYYTWIEQQGKSTEELDAQWYDYKNYWNSIRKSVSKIDELIKKFNEKVGLIKNYQ